MAKINKPGTKSTTGAKKQEKLIGISMVSAKTENVISFMYLADHFAKAIFGCKADQVTYEQAVEVIPDLMSNDKVTCIVTDMSVDKFADITLTNY